MVVVRSGVTKPLGNGAAGFHQFAGDDEIDIADAGRQRQNRPTDGVVRAPDAFGTISI